MAERVLLDAEKDPVVVARERKEAAAMLGRGKKNVAFVGAKQLRRLQGQEAEEEEELK